MLSQKEKSQLEKIQQSLLAAGVESQGLEFLRPLYKAARQWGIIPDSDINESNRNAIADYCLQNDPESVKSAKSAVNKVLPPAPSVPSVVEKSVESVKSADAFYFLTKYVLNYNKFAARPHRKTVFPFMIQDHKRLAQYLARGSFKTTSRIVRAFQRLQQSELTRYLYSMVTKEKAARVGRELKGLFDKPVVIHLFGDKRGTPWVDDAFFLKHNKSKDPSFSVTAPRSPSVGTHVTDLDIDDQYDEDHCDATWLSEVEDHVEMMYAICDAEDARITISMTIWNRYDLYYWMQEKNKELAPDVRFRIIKHPAEVVDDVTGQRRSFFPAKYTPAFLDERRVILGLRQFAQQYMLQPSDKSDASFDIDNFPTYEKLPDVAAVIFTCDPANSKKKYSDDTAMIVQYRDTKGRRYIADGIADKMNTPAERARAAVKIMRRHPALLKSGKTGWEAYGFQSGDLEALKDALNELEAELSAPSAQSADSSVPSVPKSVVEKGVEDSNLRDLRALRGGIGMRLIPIKMDNNPGSKDDRIRSMVPRSERHAYLLPPPGLIVYTRYDGQIQDLRDLVIEAIKFHPDNKPKSGQKDVLDAIQMESVIGRTPFVDTETQNRDSYEDYNHDPEPENAWAGRMKKVFNSG